MSFIIINFVSLEQLYIIQSMIRIGPFCMKHFRLRRSTLIRITEPNLFSKPKKKCEVGRRQETSTLKAKVDRKAFLNASANLFRC